MSLLVGPKRTFCGITAEFCNSWLAALEQNGVAPDVVELGDPLAAAIPDPVKVGRDLAFDAAYDELSRRVGGWAPRLVAS